MSNYRIISDGTPAGTQLTDEHGRALACSRLTWTFDATSAAKLIQVHGAAIDALAGGYDNVRVEMETAAFMAGRKAEARRILQMLLPEIENDAVREALAYRDERERAIVALRDLCKYVGDNDWPDELDLADIIEKHIVNRLADWQCKDTGA